MRVFARKFLGIRCAVRGGTVEIARNSDRRYRNGLPLRELLLEVAIPRLPFCKAKAPTVIVDHDADVIRGIEGGRGTAERRLVKIPLRGTAFPDQLVEFVSVLAVAEFPPFGREVILVPPPQFGLRWQRLLVCFEIRNQVSAHSDDRLTTFRPERRHDGSCSGA